LVYFILLYAALATFVVLAGDSPKSPMWLGLAPLVVFTAIATDRPEKPPRTEPR